jgi:hypothetical protein
MRASLLNLLAILVLTGCCQTRYEVCPESRKTPEDAYRLFRAALLTREPVLMYESFSKHFRNQFGIPGLREFVAAWKDRESDFDRLASVVEDAEVGEVEMLARAGVRFAKLPVTAYGRTVHFILIEVPLIRLEADLEPYGRTPFVDAGEWRNLLTVDENGQVTFRRPYDASESGILDPEEIHELRFHREWLLFDLPDLPDELKDLLSQEEAQP